MKKEDTLNIVKYRIELAYNTIKESESHLSNGFLNTAMNRVYYAGFYIVSALAAIDHFSTSKHKKLIGYFNKEYIKTGKITKEVGEILNLAYENRQAADYQDFITLTKTQIEDYRVRMTKLIEQVDFIVKEKLKNL